MQPLPLPPVIPGYSFIRPLGSGGFSQVFLYEQETPRRQVALKVLNASATAEANQNTRQAFAREADLMARISVHPAALQLYAASITDDGRPYLAMEYCARSLREAARGKVLQLHEVLDIGVRLAGVLESAHRAGILHRDIKPSNILINALGRPVLADFGIAVLARELGQKSTAQAMSIPWAAPEIIAGDSQGSVATEIWSLAATLYALAAGHSPFAARNVAKDTAETLKKRIAKAQYVPVPGASGYAHFDAAIARALQRDPSMRYSSMREFAEALQNVQRAYGWTPTQFEVAAIAGEQQAGPQLRGPVITQIQTETRAQKRARQKASSVPESRGGGAQSAVKKAVLVGAASGAVVLALGILLFWLVVGGS